jgi:S1-C subfamily serine protease
MKKTRTVLIVLAVLIMLTATVSAKSKAFIGVNLDSMSGETYKKLGVDGQYGILITGAIKNTGAEKAGLQKKDVLLELDKEKVYTIDQLTKMLAKYKPGDKVTLNILRKQKKMNVDVILGEKKGPKKKAYMGVFLSNLDSKDHKKLDSKSDYGILITSITEGGPADDAEIEDNDILLELNKEKIYTVDQLTKMLNNYEPEQEATIKILREGKEKKMKLVFGENENVFFTDTFSGINLPNMPNLSNFFAYKYDEEPKIWMGVHLSQTTTKTDDEENSEIVISKVIEGTPADKAGLKKDDKILKADGEEIESIGDLTDVLQDKDVSDTVKLEIERKEKIKHIDVGLEQRKDRKKMKISIEDDMIYLNDDGEKKVILELEQFEELGDKMKCIMLDKTEDLKEYKIEIQKEFEDAKDDMKDIQIEMKRMSNDLRSI